MAPRATQGALRGERERFDRDRDGWLIRPSDRELRRRPGVVYDFRSTTRGLDGVPSPRVPKTDARTPKRETKMRQSIGVLAAVDVPPPAVPLAMLDLQPLVVPGAEAF